MTLPVLSPLETRVLGVLIEKQRTVPDSYPLTLVALTAGCNQKSSRDPVLDVTEADVQEALDGLKRLSLIIETSGGRVMRYAHNFERVLGVPSQAAALLAVLMLRGSQTVGELRINSERLHRFADISSVDAFLRELAARSPALVIELPRQPGSRESRWAHLLAGKPTIAEKAHIASTVPSFSADTETLSEMAALRAEVAQLKTELVNVKAAVARLCKKLGIRDGD